MSDAPATPDPLDAWLPALVAGELVPAERTRLAERLRADPQARQRYADYLLLHGLLRWEYAARPALGAAGAADTEVAGARVAVRPAAASSTSTRAATRPSGRGAAPTTRRISARRRALRLPRRGGGLRPWALAAALALAVLGAWSAGVLPLPPAVAVLAADDDAVWRDGQVRPAGARLGRGELALVSGLARVRLSNGVLLTLEGPATLDVQSQDTTVLRAGRVVARVPVQAHGFAVQVGANRVVDLGTEFGVRAADGRMLVKVFDGEVEVGRAGGGQAATRLTLGAAVAVPDAGGAPLPVADSEVGTFARSLPGELTTQGLEQGLVGWWKLDEGQGAVVHDASGHGHVGHLAGGDFAGRSTPGPFGRALRCDGVSTYAVVPCHPDFDVDRMSVQAWVRPEGQLNADAQIVSKYCGYGLAMPKGLALKFYFWDMDHILAYRFPSGRWYHVCGVYDGKQRLLYVDGAPIGGALSGRAPNSAGEILIGALRPQVGGDVAYFTGAIADVRLYERALAPEEVRRLYLIGEEKVRGLGPR